MKLLGISKRRDSQSSRSRRGSKSTQARRPYGDTGPLDSAEVIVTATMNREDRKLDASLLSWGIEKTLNTSIKRSEVARQKLSKSTSSPEAEAKSALDLSQVCRRILTAFNPEPTATAVRFPVTLELFDRESNHSRLEDVLAIGYTRVVRCTQFP